MPSGDVSEADFMASLLGDIESSFFNAVPSPVSSPVRKRARTRSISPAKPPSSAGSNVLHYVAGPSTPIRSVKRGRNNKDVEENKPVGKQDVEGEDLDALLAGADDWNWDDMLTPQKPKATSPRKYLLPSPNPTRLPSVATLIVKDEMTKVKGKKKEKEKWEPESCTRCVVERIQEVDDLGRLQKVFGPYFILTLLRLTDRDELEPSRSHRPTLRNGTSLCHSPR
jgi:hypothetical protein